MKISNLRALLIAADVAAVLAIGLVVAQALGDKKARSADLAEYQERVASNLSSVKSDRDRGAPRPRTDGNLGIDLANTPPPPEEKIDKPVGPQQPVDVVKKAPALDTIVQLVGLQSGTAIETSMVLYSRLDEEPRSAPVATARPTNPGRRPTPRNLTRTTSSTLRTSTAGSGANRMVYSVYRGEAIEVSHEFYATVKEIRTETKEVVFEYDGEEVTVLLPKKEASPTTNASTGTTSNEPEATPNDDPGTWLTWDKEKPSSIKLTATGVASMRAKGDSILEGVRWSTEQVPDRGKMRPAVQVGHVPPNSVLARSGMQDGDVILSVNGENVSSRGDIVNYVKRNNNLPNYTVRILSRGRVISRTVQRP